MRARQDCGICGAPRAPGENCRPCANARNAKYKERHKAAVAEARSAYKKRKHAEAAADRAMRKAAKRLRKPLAKLIARAAWKQRNRGAVNAGTAARFAARRRALAPWRSDFAISEVYDLASRRTSATGVEWQVDHIVPLRSSLVCGLHCEGNLRVIPARLNLLKGNRAWPDMPRSCP